MTDLELNALIDKAAAIAYEEGTEYAIPTIGHFDPAAAAYWHTMYTRKQIRNEILKLKGKAWNTAKMA